MENLPSIPKQSGQNKLAALIIHWAVAGLIETVNHHCFKVSNMSIHCFSQNLVYVRLDSCSRCMTFNAKNASKVFNTLMKPKSHELSVSSTEIAECMKTWSKCSS